MKIRYVTSEDRIEEISNLCWPAGCYEDNVNSLQMLRKIGFVRYPNGDCMEKNCFTGEKTVQLE